MRPHPNIVASWRRGSLLVVCLLFSGCRSWIANSSPKITFSTIPAAGVGDPDKTLAIAGRAVHLRTGQQIVLYSKSNGLWWIQPSTNRPITTVQDDSRWQNQIHAGSEYAALLADPGYVPPDTLEVLPSPVPAMHEPIGMEGSVQATRPIRHHPDSQRPHGLRLRVPLLPGNRLARMELTVMFDRCSTACPTRAGRGRRTPEAGRQLRVRLRDDARGVHADRLRWEPRRSAWPDEHGHGACRCERPSAQSEGVRR